MIRYFGFLANRVWGRQLPRVHEALRMETRGNAQKPYFDAWPGACSLSLDNPQLIEPRRVALAHQLTAHAPIRCGRY